MRRAGQGAWTNKLQEPRWTCAKIPGRCSARGGSACLLEPEAVDSLRGKDGYVISQVRRLGHVLGVILLGPGEVFVLVIITAVVVLLAVRGRNVK